PRAPQDGTAMPGAAGGNVPSPGSAAAVGASGVPGAANDPTVRLPAGSGASRASAAAGDVGYTGTDAPGGPWPNQPPLRSAPGAPPRRGPGTSRSGRRPRRLRRRWVLGILAGSVVGLLILVIGGYFYLDGKLNRSNVLVSYAGQPAAGAGSNWLITGSDSRQGLTRKQERKYHTGRDVNGQRSDTILLLHISGNGGPAGPGRPPPDFFLQISGDWFHQLKP